MAGSSSGSTAPTTNLDALVTGAGFRQLSELFQMRVPLPLAESPKWPDGIAVRAFEPGRGRSRLAPGQQPGLRRPPRPGRLDGRDARSARVAEPWFDPAGFLLAFAGPTPLAGFCWTKVHEAER